MRFCQDYVTGKVAVDYSGMETPVDQPVHVRLGSLNKSSTKIAYLRRLGFIGLDY